LTLSRKRFIQEVQTRFPTITRPREGDLVYFPLSKSLFEINFVEHENPFYQLGKLYSFRLTCELFSYDQENVSTGTTDIDSTQTENRQYTYRFTTGNDLNGITLNNFYAGEVVYQCYGITGAACTIENATGTGVVAFKPSGITGYVELMNISGSIVINNTLKGADSGIEANVLVANGQTTNIVIKNSEDKTPAGDNDEIETEVVKMDIFDFTETDPFSEGNY